jgi:hypothetical protein
MALTSTLASVFMDQSDPHSWPKLKNDHRLARLRSKFWGKKIEDEAKEWRDLQPTVTVKPTNGIGPDCYGLDLGIKLRGAKLWVRQDYIRIYDYCSKRSEEGLSYQTEMVRSVVIIGQPGIGVFLSLVSCALSNNPLREKVKHIGTPTPFVVVSAKRSHFFGIEMVLAFYLSRTECFNKMSRVSPPMTLRHSYGRSLIRTDAQLVFPNNSVVFTQTSLLCSPPLRNEGDGRL